MKRELLLDDPDRASFPRKRESRTWIPAFAGMTKRNGLQARLAWNSLLIPPPPFDLSTPFDRLRDRAQSTASSGTTGRGLEPAPGLIRRRGSFPRTRSSNEKKEITYKAIPKTIFPRHTPSPPAPVRPPSSFRRKPESRGHLSPRPRLSPGRRGGTPAEAGIYPLDSRFRGNGDRVGSSSM